MKRSKEDEIILNIYRKMFKKAEPSADIDELIESGEAKKDQFFMKYYLKDREQDRIIHEELQKHKKLPKWKKDRIKRSVHLGAAPCSSFERWIKETNQDENK